MRNSVLSVGFRKSRSTRLIIPCDSPAPSASRVMEIPLRCRSSRSSRTTAMAMASRSSDFDTLHGYLRVPAAAPASALSRSPAARWCWPGPTFRRGFNPTSRIRPWFKKSSNGKWLMGSGEVARRWSKVSVVQTYPISIPRFLCIIIGQYVFALQHAEEKWQGTSLLEHRRK